MTYWHALCRWVAWVDDGVNEQLYWCSSPAYPITYIHLYLHKPIEVVKFANKMWAKLKTNQYFTSEVEMKKTTKHSSYSEVDIDFYWFPIKTSGRVSIISIIIFLIYSRNTGYSEASGLLINVTTWKPRVGRFDPWYLSLISLKRPRFSYARLRDTFLRILVGHLGE